MFCVVGFMRVQWNEASTNDTTKRDTSTLKYKTIYFTKEPMSSH